MKKILTVLVVLVVLGACIGGFFIWRHSATTIGKKAALEIALTDAGVERAKAYDIDTEYEHGYYEISFDSAAGEHEYRIDAKTGEILSGHIDH